MLIKTAYYMGQETNRSIHYGKRTLFVRGRLEPLQILAVFRESGAEHLNIAYDEHRVFISTSETARFNVEHSLCEADINYTVERDFDKDRSLNTDKFINNQKYVNVLKHNITAGKHNPNTIIKLVEDNPDTEAEEFAWTKDVMYSLDNSNMENVQNNISDWEIFRFYPSGRFVERYFAGSDHTYLSKDDIEKMQASGTVSFVHQKKINEWYNLVETEESVLATDTLALNQNDVVNFSGGGDLNQPVIDDPELQTLFERAEEIRIKKTNKDMVREYTNFDKAYTKSNEADNRNTDHMRNIAQAAPTHNKSNAKKDIVPDNIVTEPKVAVPAKKKRVRKPAGPTKAKKPVAKKPVAKKPVAKKTTKTPVENKDKK